MPAISEGKKKRINHQKMNYIISLYNNTQQKEYISHNKIEKIMAKISSEHSKFDNQCQYLSCLQCC